jgi:ABC-type antimicrobial peptide transport system permease subunit
MIKNYIKIALRNIVRHKGYSFINIAGLAVGMACCILILLWVQDELSYDKFHKDAESIYHVLAHTDVKNISVTPTLLAPTLKETFPEIVDATRYHWLFQDILLSYKNTAFNEKGLRLVDPSFFKVFTFPFLKGNPDTALNDPYSIVVSEAIAEKYFSNEDPMGKTLTMNNQHQFTITGVIENVPRNSTLQFDMVIPIEYRISTTDSWYTQWNNFFPFTFIKLQDNCNIDDINEKIAHVAQKHGSSENTVLTVLSFTERYFFFYSDVKYVYIFLAIAIFILVIACINFINLSTARSANRAKEISIRKIVGAHRKNIIFQFLGESLILSFTALIFALVLVELLLPLFNTITEKELSLSNSLILPLAIGLALFSGIAAGGYPALFLSAFHPVKTLKGKMASGSKSSVLRKVLVVVQFSLSIILIISAFAVYKQIDYMKHLSVGYEKEFIVSISMGGGSEQYYRVFKNELLDDARIIGVTGAASGMPYFYWTQSGWHWEGKDPNKEISVCYNMVDYDFVEILKIELLEGRDFSKEVSSDASVSLLVNEEMMKLMGVKSAVGATLTQAEGNKTGKIIGIIKNFHFQPFYNQIEPLILELGPESIDNILIRIKPGNISSTLTFIEEAWKKVIPMYPFAYSFLDEDFNRFGFRGIERTNKLINSFAILAIIISCLGLFGLASFTTEQRTKEIGIRKVLGATVGNILLLLTKDFIKWVLIASIIAWPIGYFAMSKWLQDFAYRTNIGIVNFIISALLAMTIALLTVSYQSIKAALANPVESLRYE